MPCTQKEKYFSPVWTYRLSGHNIGSYKICLTPHGEPTSQTYPQKAQLTQSQAYDLSALSSHVALLLLQLLSLEWTTQGYISLGVFVSNEACFLAFVTWLKLALLVLVRWLQDQQRQDNVQVLVKIRANTSEPNTNQVFQAFVQIETAQRLILILKGALCKILQ